MFDDETEKLIEGRFEIPVQKRLPENLKVRTEPIRYEPDEFRAGVFDDRAERTGHAEDRLVFEEAAMSVASLRTKDEARFVVDRFVNAVLERWKSTDA